MQKRANPQCREALNSPEYSDETKGNQSAQTHNSSKHAIKRHGSGGSGSSPDHDDFVMVPSDLTKDAAEVRKHKRDNFV